MDRGGMRKWTISVSTLALGVVVAASALGLRTMVASAPGVMRAASAASVPFAAAQRGGGFTTSAGTAFSVGPGLLVTNAHVTLACVANRLPIRVAGYGGTWQVTRQDEELDLALLQGSEASAIPPLALSATAHVPRDTRSLVLGYLANEETGGLYGAQGVVRQATIMVHRPESGQAKSFRAIDRNGNPVDPTWGDGVAFFGEKASQRMRWALEIGVTMGHGASGGPVIDSGGAVLAVVVADGTGTGLTSAIPLADLIDFLAAADVMPRFAVPGAYSEADWTRAYRLAAPSVVRVAC
jgi:hypothetical protein